MADENEFCGFQILSALTALIFSEKNCEIHQEGKIFENFFAIIEMTIFQNSEEEEMKSELREKLRVAVLMALSAGFMDGFTFFHYDGRFAGAQTGNVIQAGISLAQGRMDKFWDFAIPILFFVAGVMFKVFYSNHLIKRHKFDAMYLLTVQLVGLTVFALLYATILHLPNSYFVGILSFFMAIQFDTFNRAHGMAYTSVFTTGNLKAFSVNLAQWILTRKPQNLHAVRVLGCIIPSFFVGAVLATLIGPIFGNWTLFGVCVLYGIVFMIYRTEGEF